MRTIFVLAATLLAMPAVASAQRVVLLTQSSGFVHGAVNPPGGDNLVANTLESVVDRMGGSFDRTDDAAAVAGKLGDADVLVMYTTGDDLPLDVAAVRDFVDNGGGLIGIHCAADTLKTTPEFYTLLGGSFAGHPWNANDAVVLRGLDPDHPVSRPLGGRRALKEEIYRFNNFDADTVRVLVSLDTEATPKKVGGAVPVVWVKDQGQGRVVYTSLGHNEDVWRSDWYQAHLTASIRFAAGETSGSTKPNPVEFERQNIIGEQQRQRSAPDGSAPPRDRTVDSAAFMINAEAKNVQAERDNQPWVLRCVLDQRARVVVMALSPDLWAAYDAETCGLYKVWPGTARDGGMNFTGSVYDTRHGPQPQTLGITLDTFGGNDLSRLFKDGEMLDVEPSFDGYQVHGQDGVTLRYHFDLDGQRVNVTERPEAAGPNALRRDVTVEGLPEGTELHLMLANGEGVNVRIEGTNEDNRIQVEERGQTVGFLVLERDTDVSVTTIWPENAPDQEDN